MRSPSSQFYSDEELNLIDLDPVPYQDSAFHDNNSSMENYNSVATPERCVADFCLIPIGTPTASVSNEVAAVQRLMKASGLEYSMHSAGTTVEGSWNDVMEVIGKAHSLVHKNGIARVQTDIRAGSRTDKIQHFSEKVTKVESILANDSNPSTTFSTPASTPINPVSSTIIQPPPTTAQLTSYSSRVPWISASMHLRRTFVPHNNETAAQNTLSANPISRWRSQPGYHGLSVEVNLQGSHLVYFLMAAYILSKLSVNISSSGISRPPYGAGGAGAGKKWF